MGTLAKGGMEVYTSGVYGEHVLRFSTTWPGGLNLVLVMVSLCRALDLLQNGGIAARNDMFLVLFGLCIGDAK